MNNYKIIEQLRILKHINPSEETMESIKHNVLLRVQGNKEQLPFSNKLHPYYLKPILVYSTLAFALAVILLAPLTPARYWIDNAYLLLRLDFAPNNFQRASIALVTAQNKLKIVNNSAKKISPSQIHDILHATDVANEQLASLNLIGEPGKYTSNECQQIYRSYYNYLEEVENTVTLDKVDVSTNFFEIFNYQIHKYARHAELKLSQYKVL